MKQFSSEKLVGVLKILINGAAQGEFNASILRNADKDGYGRSIFPEPAGDTSMKPENAVRESGLDQYLSRTGLIEELQDADTAVDLAYVATWIAVEPRGAAAKDKVGFGDTVKRLLHAFEELSKNPDKSAVIHEVAIANAKRVNGYNDQTFRQALFMADRHMLPHLEGVTPPIDHS